MLPHLLLASTSLGMLAVLAGSAPKPRFDCGTDITTHASSDFIKSIEQLHYGAPSGGSPAARASLAARDGDNSGPITIDTVLHVVAKADKKGSITNDMPSSQMDVMNESFKPYHISFNLINVTWTTNDAWAVGLKDDDNAMKRALRQGTYRTLNLYFQTDLDETILGRCTLPSPMGNSSRIKPSLYFSDGCNVNANTMPGGDMDGYNAGKTAVHETGHWLGLLHTFEGYSCEGPGDYIDDTPVESTETDACPTDPPKRSCPDDLYADGEADPIHNYMDYSWDSCYEGFTKLQVERMRNMWAFYRSGK